MSDVVKSPSPYDDGDSRMHLPNLYRRPTMCLVWGGENQGMKSHMEP